MAKLDRYIGMSVLLAILAVLGIILGLASLFAFIDEMGELSDTYTLLDAGNFVLLTAPRRLYEMLPMAALIGCLIGLGSLASNSELTIMRAAGVSIGRIVWAVMKPMLVLMLVGVLIGEYVAPVTENKAQADRSWPRAVEKRKAPNMACGTARARSSCTSTRCSPTACCWALLATPSTTSARSRRQVLPVAPSTTMTTGRSATSAPRFSAVITPKW